jgi:hypothetical protein
LNGFWGHQVKPNYYESAAVSRVEFEASISGLLGVIGQLHVTVTALSDVLGRCGLLPPELWTSALDQAQMGRWNQKVAEAVHALRQSSPIADVLKDFEGPPQ